MHSPSVESRGPKILVTGGSRSGKSRYALNRAEDLGERRIYLATAQALDSEMADRIQHHREERGRGWTTLEEPLNVAALLQQDGVLLLDCLTLWVSNLLMTQGEDADLSPTFETFVQAVRKAQNPLVIVTNEVGMGLVPETRLGRRFRDWSGRLSQEVAQVVDEVILTCAGLPLRLK